MTFTLLFLTTCALAWALTGLLLRALAGGAHQAMPNERSMHVAPTPVGGGLALVAALLVTVPVWAWPLSFDLGIVLIVTAALSLFSAADHYRPIWPLTRLAVQAVAVAVSLSLLPDTVHFFPDVPLFVERVALALGWLWLINLTNFMDGIDGIAGAEGAAVALGIVAVLALQAARPDHETMVLALALAGACCGYLVWNWSPARIFMGDAGSIPIGYLLGWLLIALAANGAWAAALILPVLFVADATLTLLRRLLSGAKPWQPHRSHYYQRAVQAGASPPQVVLLMTACNASLVLAAVQSPRQPIAILAAGALVSWFFLQFLAQWARQGRPLSQT